MTPSHLEYETIGSLAFTDAHVQPILNDQKTLTARYDFEHGFSPGHYIELTDSKRDCFAIARINRKTKMSVEDFVKARFEGHRTYDSVEELLEQLRMYYSNAQLTSESTLTVLWFTVVKTYDNPPNQQD